MAHKEPHLLLRALRCRWRGRRLLSLRSSRTSWGPGPPLWEAPQPPRRAAPAAAGRGGAAAAALGTASCRCGRPLPRLLLCSCPVGTDTQLRAGREPQRGRLFPARPQRGRPGRCSLRPLPGCAGPATAPPASGAAGPAREAAHCGQHRKALPTEFLALALGQRPPRHLPRQKGLLDNLWLIDILPSAPAPAPFLPPENFEQK